MSTALLSRQSEDQLWAAIGEPGRRRLLDVLLDKGEATPTVLAAELPYSRQAVSKHLAVLSQVGLVSSRREGREMRYNVRPEQLTVAAAVMAQAAADWDRRLDRIKAMAEAVYRKRQSGRTRED